MKKRVDLRRMGSVWLFVLPALIPLIVFWIYPILRSVYISFTDWDYMSPTYNFAINLFSSTATLPTLYRPMLAEYS